MNQNYLVFSLIFWAAVSPLSADTAGIHLTVGESKLIHVESAKKVAVGNPNVADVTPVSDSEILVSAKAPGSTNLIFISPDGDKETRSVIVSTHNLKKSMVEIEAEIVEIDSQSALKAGLSWGSIAQGPATQASTTTPNNLSISENNFPPLLSFGSLIRQSLTASLQLLLDRERRKYCQSPSFWRSAGKKRAFYPAARFPTSLKAVWALPMSSGSPMA